MKHILIKNIRFCNLAIIITFLFLICTISVNGLSISPTELRIRSVDPNREYTFIVLVSNDMEGLVDVEIKSSDSGVVLSPNKFMLNSGEKRSVRVLLNPRRIDQERNRILLQPYANNMATQDRLTIFLNEDDEAFHVQDIEYESGIRTIIQEPQIVTLIIYGLLFVAAIMIILIFVPEIKKNIKQINSKSIEVNDKLFYKKIKKKTNNISTRLDVAEKKILDIISKVENFHTDADTWLKENTGGKYGLE